MGNRFETQDKLIAATREIIIREGVEGCSLETICQRAGFSRGAFYSNFATKDSLFAALAEDEYASLIDTLTCQVERWAEAELVADQPLDTASAEAVMTKLLFAALNAVGLNRELFVLHSELLTRSVRDPKWGERLFDLNNEFIAAFEDTLATILKHAGRCPTSSLRALTHAIIGIALRAASIHAQRCELVALGLREQPRGDVSQRERPQALGFPVGQSVEQSPARDIVETIVVLLLAASEPVSAA